MFLLEICSAFEKNPIYCVNHKKAKGIYYSLFLSPNVFLGKCGMRYLRFNQVNR
jgi:hypothetical protein